MSNQPRLQVEVGQVFGDLVVVETNVYLYYGKTRKDGRPRSPERAVRVNCACGSQRVIKLTNLVSSSTRQTQCSKCVNALETRNLASQEIILNRLHHGMIQRCYNPSSASYRSYGKRGIQVFSSWREDRQAFVGWIRDNLGDRPEGHSLDRIDVDGDYEPGNLRWASAIDQRKNIRPRDLTALHAAVSDSNRRRARLSAEQVIAATRRYREDKEHIQDLATAYGVSASRVRGAIYRHEKETRAQLG